MMEIHREETNLNFDPFEFEIYTETFLQMICRILFHQALKSVLYYTYSPVIPKFHKWDIVGFRIPR